MFYLIDTNVLIRLADRNDPRHLTVRTALRQLQQDNHQLQIASQNCIEFWNVATRPIRNNGLGLTPNNGKKLLDLLERLFPIVPDTPAVYFEWRRLVATHNVSGVQVHDAHLVATMKVRGISRILTFNTKDFTRYTNEGIIAIDPARV
ncbi:type II toxin-antitoxin system VapC family toxin [Roseofilum casamattae]|uniref:Type II toxin-antitoxin system VapC family toxin n=1 Tax=Roseofilum casamattae BLCC-M143 TaxID=3022442 RepID=A0ABT7BSB6_9CYAN|nr:type II toxin-antitoxin system VapC family toxin [Roseofilum casamattae]MDJ1182082.1 type II toxin-antitoxin system VapC family toxin [Roseofilum casamattae BLCC-M143]